jgi:L-fucose isomerase-like protein
VQAGIKFSLTSKHVSHPTSDSFKHDLQKFLGVCRVVNGVRGVRLGAVGARPGAFNTVRYSEKILERHGISVTTVDLSEIIGAANKLDASAPSVVSKLKEITGYAPRARRAVREARADGQDGRGAHRLDERQSPRRHRHPMLDLRAGELRLQRLHAHEHDEREVHAQRLRSGRHRRAHHARDATRRLHARRARGLEQQLRGRR